MLFNLNPGHTLSGGDVGTRGINGLKEEVLTRQLAVELDKELRSRGHRTNICRVDYASTLQESLNKQVALCNSVNADLNICIHFNTTIGGYGSEIFTYGGKYLIEADRVLKQLNNLGFRNRGIKDQPLSLTKRTKAKTIYIEVCFIDSSKDVEILNKYGMSGIAKAIVNGVLGENKNIKKEIKKEDVAPKYDESIPESNSIFKIPGTTGYIEQATDGRLIIHKDRGNYIAIGKGFIDCYWNNNNGKSGYKRITD
jgi:N-acetylmuramoyl-L-alanine amidase